MVLYEERRQEGEFTHADGSVDVVSVQLRKYYPNGSELDGDYVIDSRVKVGGAAIVDTREAFSYSGCYDHEMIRLAIQKFDELAAKHPTLSKTKSTSGWDPDA